MPHSGKSKKHHGRPLHETSEKRVDHKNSAMRLNAILNQQHRGGDNRSPSRASRPKGE